MVVARVTSKGQITVPKQVRERLGIRPGDELEFRFDDDRLEVRPIHRRSITEFQGLFPVSEALPFAEERALARADRAQRYIATDQSIDG